MILSYLFISLFAQTAFTAVIDGYKSYKNYKIYELEGDKYGMNKIMAYLLNNHVSKCFLLDINTNITRTTITLQTNFKDHIWTSGQFIKKCSLVICCLALQRRCNIRLFNTNRYIYALTVSTFHNVNNREASNGCDYDFTANNFYVFVTIIDYCYTFRNSRIIRCEEISVYSWWRRRWCPSSITWSK